MGKVQIILLVINFNKYAMVRYSDHNTITVDRIRFNPNYLLNLFQAVW